MAERNGIGMEQFGEGLVEREVSEERFAANSVLDLLGCPTVRPAGFTRQAARFRRDLAARLLRNS
jgi:hypothetical protein